MDQIFEQLDSNVGWKTAQRLSCVWDYRKQHCLCLFKCL